MILIFRHYEDVKRVFSTERLVHELVKEFFEENPQKLIKRTVNPLTKTIYLDQIYSADDLPLGPIERYSPIKVIHSSGVDWDTESFPMELDKAFFKFLELHRDCFECEFVCFDEE